MAIYSPEVRLSRNDKELLRLLANLILSSSEEGVKGNYQLGQTVLSDSEADRLLSLLDQFVHSKKFIEGSYLIESILEDKPNLHDGELRGIYFKWKQRFGRSRALATAQWQGFLARLGVEPENTTNIWYRSPVRRMPIEHFLKMEERLTRSADLHPKVRNLIMEFVDKQSTYIDQVRSGYERMERGQILRLPNKLLSNVSSKHITKGLYRPLTTNQIIGVAVIVMDFSALFTTRDWDVSGFMSSVAGAAPAVVLEQ